MSTQEFLGLPDRFELPHSPLSYLGRLMGLLCSIVGILGTIMDNAGHRFSMRNTITKQLIRHDLPGLTAMRSQQPLEEALSCNTITTRLKQNVNDFTILITSPPQAMPPTVDLYEEFIDEEGVAISLISALQTTGIFSTEPDAPQPDAFVAYSDATFSKQTLYVSVTEIESVVEPRCVTNDVRRESVAFVCIRGPILAVMAS